jgi:hypothetical protein
MENDSFEAHHSFRNYQDDWNVELAGEGCMLRELGLDAEQIHSLMDLERGYYMLVELVLVVDQMGFEVKDYILAELGLDCRRDP